MKTTNIKPISDLREYSKVLNSCSDGEPVFLTKNGRGKYVLLNIDDYAKQQDTIKMLAALAEAEKSIETDGLTSLEDFKKELGE